MRSRTISALIAVLSLAAGACKSDSSPTQPRTVFFNPPTLEFAQGLGIAAGPITSDQAKQIAAAAAGGTALAVEQEDQDGVQVFGVKVQAAGGNKDVKVRISDGAVTQIDSDDAAEASGGETESGD